MRKLNYFIQLLLGFVLASVGFSFIPLDGSHLASNSKWIKLTDSISDYLMLFSRSQRMLRLKRKTLGDTKNGSSGKRL